MPPLSSTTLAELRTAVAQLKADPSLLHEADLSFLRSWLTSLGATIPPPAKHEAPDSDSNADLRDDLCVEPDVATQSVDFVASDDLSEADLDKATAAKSSASEALASGDFVAAVKFYTDALQVTPSALLLAKRAECYLRLKKPNAAIKDADKALELNADSAAAFKARGKAHRLLGNWESAAVDLGQGLRIDFDETSQEVLNLVAEKAGIVKKRRLEENAKKVAEAEARKRAAEAAAAAAAKPPPGSGPGGMGGFGGMGGMGGMPGMGGMGGGGGGPDISAIMSDPEIAAAMSNPKMMAKLQAAMSNPMLAMGDPEVMNLIMKMNKLGGVGGGRSGPGAGFGTGFGGPPPRSGPTIVEEDDDDDDDGPPGLVDVPVTGAGHSGNVDDLD